MRRILTFLMLCLPALDLHLHAQGLFQLNGNAISQGGDCYRLTTATGNIFGSMWYRQKTDLSNNFTVRANLNFGTKDANGADGIVFAFQNQCTSSGSLGGSLGIGGVTPSFLVEFDVFQNPADPANDHVAILKNGNLDHNSANSLAAPQCILSNCGNVENGQNHEVRIEWTALDTTLRVFVANVLRVSYSGNVVQSIFNGNPYVYWGFTASTGGFNNEQRVCIIQYPTNVVKLDDISLCRGSSTQLSLPGGVSYTWSPNYNISNPSVFNPTIFPDTTTRYIVTITDQCSNVQRDTILVTVLPLPVVSLPTFSQSYCTGQPAFTLSGGSPSGGVYSGPGVSGGQFNPTTAGAGTHPIIYTFTDSLGCSNADTAVITVNTGTAITMPGYAPVCFNGSPISLLGASPTGGVFSGPGVSGSSFNPTTAGVGSRSITYTFTAGNGCVNSGNATIQVLALPQALIQPTSLPVICSGSPVSLQAQQVSGASYQWLLNGVSQGAAGPANTQFSAASAGSYRLRVIGSNGCMDTSAVRSISTGNQPNAGITSADTVLCPAESTSLTANTLLAGESIIWQRNGITLSGFITATLTVSQAGTYRSIVSHSSGCVDTSNALVVVQNSAPVASFTASSISFCPGTDTIVLTAPTGTGLSYQWLNAGVPISGANASVLRITNPSTIRLIMTNASGCRDTSATQNFNTATAPTVSITAPGNQICQGGSLPLQATVLAGGTYTWFLGSNTLTGPGTANAINALSAGSYTVRLTNAQGCSSLSAPFVTTIRALPTASISSPSSSFCTGSNLTIRAIGVAGASYEWFRNNVSLGAPVLLDTLFLATQAGAYKVRVNDGCTAESNTINLTVTALPGNAGAVTGGSTTFCPGDEVILSVGSVANASFYRWEVIPASAGSIGDGQGTTSVIVDLLNQNAQVRVTPLNGCGAGNFTTRSFTVDNGFFCTSSATFGALPTNTCPGTTLTFSNFTNMSNFPNTTLFWNFGPGANPATANGAGPHQVNYTSTGSKTITMEIRDLFSGFPVNSETRNNFITIQASPSTPVIQGPVSIQGCSGVSASYSVNPVIGTSYVWTAPASTAIASGQGTASIQLQFNGAAGALSLVQSSIYGCPSPTAQLSIVCNPLAIEEERSEEIVSLFPNPAQDRLMLSLPHQSSIKSIRCMSMEGKIHEISHQPNSSHSGSSELKVDHLPSGTYFLQIGLEERSVILKFLKE